MYAIILIITILMGICAIAPMFKNHKANKGDK